MTEVTFDREKHSYTINGMPSQSVTQIMKASGVVNSQWYTEWAAERGSAVHAAIHYHLEGDLDESSVDDNIRPYLEAYLNFRRDTKLVPMFSEYRVVDVARHYAGTVDLVCEINKQLAIVDWKTGAPDRAVAIQLSGYAIALNSILGKAPTFLASVQLKPDGKYKLVRQPFVPRVFLACLEISQWLKSA